MKRKIIILILSFFLTNFIIAQNKKIDSLKNELNKTNIDTVKLLYLIKLTSIYSHIKPDSSVLYGKKAVKLAKKIKHIIGELNAIINLGIAYDLLTKRDSSLILWKEGLAIADKNKLYEKQAKLCNNIAIIYVGQNDFKNSVKYLNKTISISKKNNYHKLENFALNTFGALYLNRGLYDIALEYFFKILENDDNTHLLAEVYSNIASVFANLHKYEKSNEYFEKSLNEFEKQKNNYNVALTLNNIVNNKIQTKKYDDALYLIRKSKEIIEKNNIKILSANTLYKIGLILYGQKKYNEALKYFQKALKNTDNHKSKSIYYTGIANLKINNKDFNMAKIYLDSAYFLKNSFQDDNLLKDIHENYSDYYEKTNDLKQSLKHYKLFKQLNDSIFNEKENKLTENLNIHYETEKKDQQLKLQAKENEIQKSEIKFKNYMIFVISFIFVIFLIIIFLFFRFRSQKQKLKNENEKQKLKIEVSDNTKQEISSELHTGMGSKLSGIIINLENKDIFLKEIKILRSIYQQIKKLSNLISLPDFIISNIEEEIESLVINFRTDNLDIEAIFSSKTDWKDINPIIQKNIYRIVQELLNNTQKHADANNIDLELMQYPNYINLYYEDDGKGYNPKEISTNYGYKKEIFNRIKLLNANFVDDSRLGKGAILNFKIPI